MSLSFNDYDAFVLALAKMPRDTFAYAGLALAGESGEIAEKFKKLMRDDKVEKWSQIPEEKRLALLKELGDLQYYISYTAQSLGSSLQEVVDMNVEKLHSRAVRGVLGGNGDNR